MRRFGLSLVSVVIRIKQKRHNRMTPLRERVIRLCLRLADPSVLPEKADHNRVVTLRINSSDAPRKTEVGTDRLILLWALGYRQRQRCRRWGEGIWAAATPNPKGIPQQSPGLRGTSYPGIMRRSMATLKGLWPKATADQTRPQPRW